MEAFDKSSWIWSSKYRPKTVEDCVLPKSIKDIALSYIKDGRIPTCLFSGDSGMGKTTLAIAMCEQVGADYIMINGSLDLGLDMLRTTIQQFASTVSFSDGQKVVIIDEADGLNNHVQPAMKSFIEEFASNCSFILTANIKHKLITPLISRCSEIDFEFRPSDRPMLAGQFFKRVCTILNTNGIVFDKAVVAEVINQLFPDFRKTLNQLQMYAASGEIDSGILTTLGDAPIKELFAILKEKNFTKMRKWVSDNSSYSSTKLFRELYEKGHTLVEPQSTPELILLLAKYQYQQAFVSDKELNLAALLTEIMVSLSFL